MAIKLIQTKKTTLAYGINDSATALRLTNLLKLDGTSMAASDIGEQLYGSFDPGTSREEIFSINGANATVNADGTVDITGVVRGLMEVDPYTTGGFATDHPAGAIVVFGNNPQLFSQFGKVGDPNTWAELQTFTVLPESTGGDAITDDQLVTYRQALAMALGTANINRIVVAGNGGEVLVAGNLVYLNVTDGEWYKCDADTAATVDNIILGIAQGAGTNGGAIANGVLLFGLDSNQTGLTTNTAYYASNTAGAISSTPGTIDVSVGISRSTTSLLFYPRYNQQLTENEQDLIAKLLLGTDFYGASVVGTDSYAITVDPVPAYTNGIRFRFKADVANTGACTLDVNALGAITIKKAHDVDLATGDIEANQIVEVVYNSTGPVFEMVSQTAVVVSTDVQTFTANDTWTKPSGAKIVEVIMYGGGGGGGGPNRSLAGVGGSGGGGGCYSRKIFNASDLASTVAITIGTGGAGGNQADGTAGGTSLFGTHLSAFGGGGGFKATSNNHTSGGGGGGSGSAGATGALGASSLGGFPNNITVGLQGVSQGGAGGLTNSDGRPAEYGGASGAGNPSSGAGNLGGSSLYGGAGGGGGGSNGSAYNGGAGGNVRTITAGGGGAGGAGGSGGSAGTVGTAGTAGNTTKGGTGGGGGGGTAGAGTGGTGGAGGACGGGGGGGGCSSSGTDGIGGAGGRGEITVITYL